MLERAQDVGEIVTQHAFQDGNLHKALLDQVKEGIYILDCDRRILYWNGGAERISGYMAHEVAGQYCHGDLFLHCDDDGGAPRNETMQTADLMHGSRPRELIVLLRHRLGHRLPVRVRSRPVYDAGGNVIGTMEIFEEAIDGARHGNQALRALHCLDPGSDAVLRDFGEMKLRHALEKLRKFDIPFGWLRIGLDGAGELEHRYGHGMADAAMRMIAATLNGSLKALDVLTRWNQMEFRVEVSLRSHLILVEVSERLRSLVHASALEWWGDRLQVSVSIGGVMAGRGDTLESLERRVEPVFESCQAAGGNRAAVAHAEGSQETACLP